MATDHFHLLVECLYSLAYNGAKMIVFGGRTPDKISGDLYILDVATMTWTQGPSSDPRTGMVCSVSGDNFVAWGGTTYSIHLVQCRVSQNGLCMLDFFLSVVANIFSFIASAVTLFSII
jgi:hypothetical protein